jgi:hypothetical protein
MFKFRDLFTSKEGIMAWFVLALVLAVIVLGIRVTGFVSGVPETKDVVIEAEQQMLWGEAGPPVEPVPSKLEVRQLSS